jgi:cytochrome c
VNQEETAKVFWQQITSPFAAPATAMALFAALPGAAMELPLKRDADTLAYGEYLASQCTSCHQMSGAYEGIPPIVGLEAEALIEALLAFRSGARENPVMQTIARGLINEEIVALAAYFESLQQRSNRKRTP